jgi:lysylphosphatidylglycerol synthetase-like protein (DUF2156 family)
MGSNDDPQSLHKYAYCHGNPVNAIDPSGESALVDNLLAATVLMTMVNNLLAAIMPIATGIYVMWREGISLSEFIGHLLSWQVWAHAVTGLGIGLAVGAILKTLSASVLVVVGFILSLFTLYKSWQLTRELAQMKLPREDVAFFLAVFTASIIISMFALSSQAGPRKQWVRIDKSYSQAGGFKTKYSIKWGASPAGGGKYIKKIPNTMFQKINQWFRNLKIPGKNWRVKDPGHIHIKK